MKKSVRILPVLVLAVAFAASLSVRADIISINFAGDNNDTPANITNSTGAVIAGNWNDWNTRVYGTTGPTGENLTLIDHVGDPTSLVASHSIPTGAGSTWVNNGTYNGGANDFTALFESRFDLRTNLTVTVDNVNSEFAMYDVYVYFGYSVNNGAKHFDLSVNGGASVEIFDSNTVAAVTTFVEGNNGGNYVVFTGQTSDTLTIFAEKDGRNDRPFLTGVQIVNVVPEPSSIVLLTVGSFAVLGMRSRRRSDVARDG